MPSQGATLNPFLRAFFANQKLPSLSSPSTSHILLVPSTDFLLTHKEKETQAYYTDLVGSEDILSCHVIKAPVPAPVQGKDAPSLRDTKGRAKQYSTINGKSVIIKDNYVYTNKGFKNLNQVQLLSDAIYQPDGDNAQSWLIYFISRPLVGHAESLVPELGSDGKPVARKEYTSEDEDTDSSDSKRRDIKSFQDILDNFPIIGRQMRNALDKLYIEFSQAAERSFVDTPYSAQPPVDNAAQPSRPKPDRSLPSSNSLSSLTGSTISVPDSKAKGTPENQLRTALENLVMSAIETFQGMDKHQLSFLGSSTNLSGSEVEKMIEKHVTEHFHDKLLFPRICDLTKDDDAELGINIKQMSDVDLSQVGASLEDGLQYRREYSARLKKGVEAFRKMETAESSQEMVDILLETERSISASSSVISPSDKKGREKILEKTAVALTISADTLVAMLLIVIIRSSVTHLQARLAYMRDFVFLSEVESGEIGYALSTYEGVLAYLTNNANGLRRVSKANRSLWIATKKGDLPMLKKMLQPVEEASQDEAVLLDDEHIRNGHADVTGSGEHEDLPTTMHTNGHTIEPGHASFETEPTTPSIIPDAPQDPFPLELIRRVKKRVSMESRSMSGSSVHSLLSSISTIKSNMTMSGEISASQLSQTRDFLGNSVLIMAASKGQSRSLDYLLHVPHLFTIDGVLEDANDTGSTVLSIAIQSSHAETIDTLLDYLVDNSTLDDETLRRYISRQDDQGRCAAHYLFNAPQLIQRLSNLIPWNIKDKNGQTPLFALCRCYDHDEYARMVEDAITAATRHAPSTEALQLDDHVDVKGNSLLHIVNNARLIRQLLARANSDPNASNEKNFTPMMLASKFARLDVVRVLFADPRLDLQARDHRSLTAVELAKDDEVRNRIDDMVLASSPSRSDGQITTIVRSFFVEDGTVRMVLKHAIPNSNNTITVTTSRRSVADFENLARWLSVEHPASFMPLTSSFRSPFQIPSKPSRAVLRDTQLRLESFLQALLVHPTFSTHEMVWEFMLVPDIDMTMLAERSQNMAGMRADKLREEYEPLLEDFSELDLFVDHASEQINSLNRAFQRTAKSVNAINNAISSLSGAWLMTSNQLENLKYLPPAYEKAFKRSALQTRQREYGSFVQLHYSLLATLSNTQAMLQSLARPAILKTSIFAAREQVSKFTASASRSQRWPATLGLLEDTRSRVLQENLDKANKAREEMKKVGRELRYTHETVASELAGWQAGHADRIKEELRVFTRKTVTIERTRLEGMMRALRSIRKFEDGEEEHGDDKA